MTDQIEAGKVYLTTKEVCKRYGVCRRTIYRWMERKEQPFPAPVFGGSAGFNRWHIDDIRQFDADARDQSADTMPLRQFHHAS
ncbi:helix-turn-helix transcriptional regulator [Salinicola halophilus]|uniref:helix-turn-helix transcriptional regulator n=1 Tax=Salinicola halophilus TaxID=184065 RepID=UPI000DA219CB|nr:helix-turn-helix domain-containing protein [Salinicola halophilus]